MIEEEHQPDTGEAPGAPTREFVAALARGLQVLETFSPETPALGLSELARRAGLGKRTTYRIATTLESLGYLMRDPEKRYRPGIRVLDLGFTALESMDLRQVARPFLDALGRETREFVSLAVLDGRDIVYIETLKAPGVAVGIQTHIGYRQPAHCTSHGKVLLAALTPDHLGTLLSKSPLEQQTPNTITDPQRLVEELRLTRSRGFAINEEESSPGVRSVAAPIRDRSGVVIGSVNLAVPTMRASRLYLETELAPRITAAANGLSAALGYRANPSGDGDQPDR